MTALATMPSADVPTRGHARGHDATRPRLLRAVPTDPPYLEDADPDPSPPLDLLLRPAGVAELDLPELAFGGDLEPGAEGGAATQSRAVESELRRLFGHRRTPRSALPAPAPRAAAAVRLLLEVVTGDRPSRQVSGWVSPQVMEALDARTPHQHRTLPRRPVLRSLRVTEPSDGAAEVSAVVRCGERHRAVALRLEGLDGRWVVTALHVG